MIKLEKLLLNNQQQLASQMANELLVMFPENNFFKNSYNFKTGFVATLKAINGDYLKISLNYNQGSFVIPNTNNEEITTTLKFFN